MMWRWVGLVMGLLLALTSLVSGGELPPPMPRKDRPVADELYLRRIHKEWNNLPITTTNPNGAIRGQRMDQLVYDTGAGVKHCLNSSTAGEGLTWVCAPSVYTAP